MKPYPFSASRIFGVPLAIHPTKGKVIARALADRLNVTSVTVQGADGATMMEDDWDYSEPAEERGYEVVNGVAVVPVSGTLVHKGTSLRPYSGMLGYNAIRHNLMLALNDDSARAVVLDCNSPGGEVSGCFDLVDAIYEARGDKPITAICDDMAYSACYAIASACDSIILPRTGGVGSIGVITMHAEYSKALRGAGVEVTIFQYGDRKADGNPYNPLSKEAAERFQADIDELGELFVDTVARNRGIAASKIKATQAATYMGAAGVDAGLADAVMAPDEAFRVLLAELG
jgi:signal peptide peptidase SppA